jgi:hypothetical protein
MGECTKFGDLTLEIEKKEDATVLKWIGESNDLDPTEKLKPFFDELMKSISGNLVINFSELVFMNSVTVQPLLRFIINLDENNIKTEIQYDKNSTWQISSFKAMGALIKVLKNISVTEV